MKKFFTLAFLLAFAAGFAPDVALAKSDLLHFNKARVINVCQRACMRGGSPARCCVCNGGDWTGKFCT